MLHPSQYKFVKDIQHWADIFYKIKTGKSQVDSSNDSYRGYLNAVGEVYDAYEKQKPQLPQRLKRRRQQPAKKCLFHLLRRRRILAMQIRKMIMIHKLELKPPLVIWNY